MTTNGHASTPPVAPDAVIAPAAPKPTRKPRTPKPASPDIHFGVFLAGTETRIWSLHAPTPEKALATARAVTRQPNIEVRPIERREVAKWRT